MESLTGFGMKNSTTLPSLINKFFNSVRIENVEFIYTYNDEDQRRFLRLSIREGKCVALNQRYKSSFSNKVFDIISEKLHANGNVCENVEKKLCIYKETFKNNRRKV